MTVKVYRTDRSLGYAVMSMKQPKIDTTADYHIVGYAAAVGNRPIIERTDGKEYEGQDRWIVDHHNLSEVTDDESSLIAQYREKIAKMNHEELTIETKDKIHAAAFWNNVAHQAHNEASACYAEWTKRDGNDSTYKKIHQDTKDMRYYQ